MIIYSERWRGKARDRGMRRRKVFFFCPKAWIDWLVCARNGTRVNKRRASYLGWGGGRGYNFHQYDTTTTNEKAWIHRVTWERVFSLIMLTMFHSRRRTLLPRFMCSVLISLLLCCFGSHYSFCFRLSCKWESLQFVAFGRFGSEPVSPENGRVPLHKKNPPLSLWPYGYCLSLSQIKVQARSFPTNFLQTVSIVYARQRNSVQNAVGATVRGS